jgi:hypothetical protein
MTIRLQELDGARNFTDVKCREEMDREGEELLTTYQEEASLLPASPLHSNASSSPSSPPYLNASKVNERISPDAVDDVTDEVVEEDGENGSAVVDRITEPTRFPYRITNNPRDCLFGPESFDHLFTHLTDREWQHLLDIGIEHIDASTSRRTCLYFIAHKNMICSRIGNVQTSYLCRL